jgi:RNA polymerase sigma-70 factor (ECF subfamily)
MTRSDNSKDTDRSRFATTQWSLVVAAGDLDNPSARDALAHLCRSYWLPIYVYLRRRGADEERARDLTQGFFAKLLEKNYVGDARRDRGRFRTFLLTSLKHFVANEWDRETAQKRGGGRSPISLDDLDAEGHYKREPAHEDTPERLFDRRWARTLLEASLDRLREESTDPEARGRHESLVPFMTGDSKTGYREAAAGLGMSESAARMAVHRMRRRFRAIVREEVARTVGEHGAVDDELRYLFSAMEA